MSVASAVSAFALVVASVDIADVFPLTVDVKLVISVASAVSALALVVASVAIADVFVPTVDVKLVKELAVALCALVTVTISPCAVAMAPDKVLPVKLVATK